jgi:amino acid permease
MKLFIKKPIKQLMAATAETEKSLKRTLGVGSLIALGIGAIIGAGIFVRTAAAAGEHAGPAVTISFIIAAALPGSSVGIWCWNMPWEQLLFQSAGRSISMNF